VRIAVTQLEPRIGEKERNVERALAAIGEAAGRGAELVVLPELATTGYVFESLDEARALSEPVPGGKTTELFVECCRAHGVVVVVGVAEQAGGALYNSAVVVGPGGHLGTYRKLHLWDQENRWFRPGDRGVPVVDTPVGRLATIVCYDGWFPECFRLAAMNDADVVCIPTNWVPIPGQAPDAPAMATLLCQGAAHVNSIPVAAADRVGVERGQPFIGQSVIVSHTGWPVAGPASTDREEILVADVEPAEARAARRWNEFNDPVADRRADVYG
jgi:predicted amidohydrolase